jgi:hypothetical protein
MAAAATGPEYVTRLLRRSTLEDECEWPVLMRAIHQAMDWL